MPNHVKLALPVAPEPMPFDEMVLHTTPDGLEIITAPNSIAITTELLNMPRPDGSPLSIVITESDILCVIRGINRTVTYRQIALNPDGRLVICHKVSDTSGCDQ